MKERITLAFQIAVAYLLGIVVANAVATLVFGFGYAPLAIAFTVGAWVLASPLLAIAFLVGLLQAPEILKRPRLWAGAAATISIVIYVLLDRPDTLAAQQRDGLAAASAICAAVTFVGIGGWFRSPTKL